MNLNIIRIFIFIALNVYCGLAAASTYHVDAVFGDDSWNGTSNIPGSPNGPKKSIAAALKIPGLLDNDNIEIAGGVAFTDRLVIKININFVLLDDITIKSLTMNASGKKLGIQGGRDLIVTDTINLILGNIDGSITNCNLVSGPACKVLGGSRNSFIEGRFYRTNNQTTVTDLYYPIGSGADFRPLYMSFVQTTTQPNRYVAQLISSIPPVAPLPPGIKYPSALHYWNLRYTGSATPSQFKFKAYYDQVTVDDEAFDPPKLRLILHQPVLGKYINLGGTGTAKNVGNITSASTTDTLGNLCLANTIGGTNTLGHKTPLAKFGVIGKCVNAQLQFKDSSFTNKSSITRRFWDFGTGNPKDTSNLPNPKFAYTGVGPWTAYLRVWNNLGFDDTFFVTMTLVNGPKSKFPNGDACYGYPIAFKDSSTVNAPDSIKSTRWELGDGNVKTVKNFVYSYALSGPYSIRLITTSSSGCVDTFTKNITVYKNPTASYTTQKICFNETTAFSGAGGNSGDTITGWKWFVDGVLTATNQKFTKKFAAAQNYSVVMTVISQTGCVDTVVKTITIFQNPVASFCIDKTIAGNDSVQCFKNNFFYFKEQSKSFQGQLLTPKYFWGNPETIGTSSGNRTVAGVFPVKLIVTSDKGCKDSITSQYKVYDKITVKFGVATYCLPTPADFSDSSNAGSAGINLISWKYGDGGTGTGANTSHVYASGGNYTARLIVRSTDGCRDSADQTVAVTSKPTISLTLGSNNPFCASDSLKVQVAGGLYVKWGDGDTSRLRYIKTAGKFYVSAYTSKYCFVSDSFDAKKHPPVFPDAGQDTSLIRGRYLILKGDGGIKYEWTPRNQVETPDSVRTKVRPLQTQKYYLKVTDGNNCVAFDSVLVKVIEPLFIRIPNMITPNGDGKNDAWDLREVPNVENGKVSIYNAVGQLVFVQNTGYNHTWNGISSEGTPLPVGNYLFVIEIPTEKEPYKGYLHIAR